MENKENIIIHEQARRVIYNVVKFCNEEKKEGQKISTTSATERAVASTGYSKTTICKIRKEGRKFRRLG